MIVEEAQKHDADSPPNLENVEQIKEKAKELITEHPLVIAAGAVAIGAMLGLVRARGGKGGALSAAITGIVMTLMRDAVVRRVSTYANHWIDLKSREESASRQREVGSFVEH
ncbi:MAG: hypothetical protein H0V17_32465 [Deltaproteobacteria bacterium]|nr:hypothetical protein [Deltaproteobacteria bacterium]